MGQQSVGVLLAGGAARRFGGHPKGLATIGGVRIADRVLAGLREATTEQLIVANDPRAAIWFHGERVVSDEVRGLGPLAGLAAALAAASGSGILVVAWDMPFVTRALLRALREWGETGVDAVVPVHGAERRAEPVCAYYAARALTTCRALLDAGTRNAGALADALVDVARVGDEQLAPFGDLDRIFTSIDSPAQLAAVGGTFDEAAG